MQNKDESTSLLRHVSNLLSVCSSWGLSQTETCIIGIPEVRLHWQELIHHGRLCVWSLSNTPSLTANPSFNFTDKERGQRVSVNNHSSCVLNLFNLKDVFESINLFHNKQHFLNPKYIKFRFWIWFWHLSVCSKILATISYKSWNYISFKHLYW